MNKKKMFFIKPNYFLLLGISLSLSVNLFASEQPYYIWPQVLDDSMARMSRQERLVRLANEINSYGRLVGSSIKIPELSETARDWILNRRKYQWRAVHATMSVKGYCKAVRREFVDKLFSPLPDDPKQFRQYGNCGEGASVGACLAYSLGFEASEILLCESTQNHLWSMVPSVAGSYDYCLLDRWNSFRCGLRVQGDLRNRVNVQVPGKKNFAFSDAKCRRLSDIR